MAKLDSVLTFDIGTVEGSHEEPLPGDYSDAITLVVSVSLVNNIEQPYNQERFAWFSVQDSINRTDWWNIEDTQGKYRQKFPTSTGKRERELARIVVPFAPHLRLQIWVADKTGRYWEQVYGHLFLHNVTADVYVRRV